FEDHDTSRRSCRVGWLRLYSRLRIRRGNGDIAGESTTPVYVDDDASFCARLCRRTGLVQAQREVRARRGYGESDWRRGAAARGEVEDSDLVGAGGCDVVGRDVSAELSRADHSGWPCFAVPCDRGGIGESGCTGYQARVAAAAGWVDGHFEAGTARGLRVGRRGDWRWWGICRLNNYEHPAAHWQFPDSRISRGIWLYVVEHVELHLVREESDIVDDDPVDI